MPDLMRRSLLAGGLVGVAGLTLLPKAAPAQDYGQGGEAPQAEPAAAANQVVIQNMAFDPATLSVAAGATVTFVNQDAMTHTVTSDEGAFDVQLSAGQSAQMTFPGAATYAYHCEIHPSMRGTLTVA